VCVCVYGKSKGKDFGRGRVRVYEWMKFGGFGSGILRRGEGVDACMAERRGVTYW